ncbi:unnamed protein product [Cuscuta epithymum]|uniref:FAD-binding PCMH-type domain-containing protein n=1 Tax=Cuscuta epithymum TaxID=186058 RepID=A0AAV0EHX7_9ASTE|nr:unnamed protein product [Cuscuta epithymum]
MTTLKNPTTPILSLLFSVILPPLLLSTSAAAADAFSAYPSSHQNFSQCVINNSPSVNPNDFYTQKSSNFTSVLNSTAQNFRLLVSSVPKPQLIFTPANEDQVRAAVICTKQVGNLQFKVRSGGHDYEGLSYTSSQKTPFVIVDLSKLRRVDVNLNGKTAWAQAGATMGEVYYKISNASKGSLAFPAGLCSSLGVGGHITGGAYGPLMRMYGLGADNVLDVRMVDAEGKVLTQQCMGPDVFWAIRGGGGGSFGVILAWKLKLVTVPKTVTVFTVPKTLEQGASDVFMQWQNVTATLPNELFIRVVISPAAAAGKNKTIQTTYNAMFLGPADRLVEIMTQKFPKLGLTEQNCNETSWIKGMMYTIFGFPTTFPPEYLLEGKPLFQNFFKAKSDFVKTNNPIPAKGLEGLWDRMLQEDSPLVILTPYGGRMAEIDETAIPFPHRKGVLCMIQYVTTWSVDGGAAFEAKHMAWIRDVYNYMAPFVSTGPREAYVNYRDLDLGKNNNAASDIPDHVAKLWGNRYFKQNFQRLVKAKCIVDPGNFFRHEQSIPLPLNCSAVH